MFGSFKNILYLCIVFFIVLDLRLTKVWGLGGAPFFLFCIVFDFHYLCTRYRKVSRDLSTSRSLFKQIENAETDLELKKRRLPMFMFPYSWDMGRGSISIEF